MRSSIVKKLQKDAEVTEHFLDSKSSIHPAIHFLLLIQGQVAVGAEYSWHVSPQQRFPAPPRCSRTRWDMLSLRWVLWLAQGLLPVRRAQKNEGEDAQEASDVQTTSAASFDMKEQQLFTLTLKLSPAALKMLGSTWVLSEKYKILCNPIHPSR